MEPGTTKQPRIQVLLDDIELTPDIAGALRAMDAEVQLCRLGTMRSSIPTRSVDARLVLTSSAAAVTQSKLNTLLQWFDRDPCATLVLSESPLDETRRVPDAAHNRGIGFAANLSQETLAGRLTAMCGLRDSLVSMRRQLDVLRDKDSRMLKRARRLDDELRLAGAVQRDLMCAEIPLIAGAEVETLYHPSEVVSGDVFSVARLDETHVGFSIADATGHGIAAALLSMFIQRTLRDRDADQTRSQPTPPDKVLQRLNNDILGAELNECHFVTALHAVYDERARIIRWARGGAPYPILVRPGDNPSQLTSDGPLVGALEDPRFSVGELQLHPGDTLVFHTDGLNALLLAGSNGISCRDLDQCSWFQTLGEKPFRKHLEQIRTQLDQVDEAQWQADDVTVVALHIPDPAANRPELLQSATSNATSVMLPGTLRH